MEKALRSSVMQYRLNAVSIIATQRCNARCRACGYWRKEGGHDFDSSHLDQLLSSLIRHQVERVVWTGGEPTLHPNLPEMMAKVKKAGLANTLITNGTILHRELDRLAESVDTVILSLDAPNRILYEEIRGVDAFYQLIKIPARIMHSYPRVGVVLCCLLQRRNIDYMEEFLEMAADLRVDRVAFLMPDFSGYDAPEDRGDSFGRQGHIWGSIREEIMPTEKQLRDFRDRIPSLRALYSNHPHVDCPTLQFLEVYYHHFQALRSGMLPAQNPPCPMPGHHTVITSDGKLKPCFFVSESVTLDAVEDPLRNVELDSLREALIKNPEVRERSCRLCLQTVRSYS